MQQTAPDQEHIGGGSNMGRLNRERFGSRLQILVITRLLVFMTCLLAQMVLAQSPCSVLWQVHIGPVSQSSPAIGADGSIYIANDLGLLFSISPNGQTNWVVQSGGGTSPSLPPNRTPMVAADRRIYHGTNAFDQGGRLWQTFPGGTRFSAAGSYGELYALDANRNVLCLRPDGMTNWLARGNEEASEPIAGPSGEIYIGGYHSPVVALNGDGSFRWDFHAFDYGSTLTAIDGAGNICASIGANLLVVRPDGNTNFVFPATGQITTGVSIASDGTLCFGDANGVLFAVNTNFSPRPNGVPPQFQRWKMQTAGPIYSTPAISEDGLIYLASSVGGNASVIYVVSTNGPQVMPGYPPPSCNSFAGLVKSALAIGTNGNVYFATTAGDLIALRGSAPLANSPWPMYRGDPRHTARSGGAAITPPKIQQFTRTNNQAQLAFSSEWGRRYSLQTSSDLESWSGIGSVVTNTSVAVLTDTNSPGIERFYRIASP